jgi:hypothetical protein
LKNGRPPSRDERTHAARRLGRNFQAMSEENASDADEHVLGVIDGVLGTMTLAGAGAAAALVAGATLTLGHVIAILAGVLGLGGSLYRRWRARTS